MYDAKNSETAVNGWSQRGLERRRLNGGGGCSRACRAKGGSRAFCARSTLNEVRGGTTSVNAVVRL